MSWLVQIQSRNACAPLRFEGRDLLISSIVFSFSPSFSLMSWAVTFWSSLFMKDGPDHGSSHRSSCVTGSLTTGPQQPHRLAWSLSLLYDSHCCPSSAPSASDAAQRPVPGAWVLVPSWSPYTQGKKETNERGRPLHIGR